MSDVTRAGLAAHTSIRLGGPATCLLTATNQDELVQMASTEEAPVLLAGGSNVIISDKGVSCPVVLVRTAGIRIERAADSDHVLLTAQAGHDWDDVVGVAVAENLAGIESLSGVPGSAGATPIQNVGAYGQEVAETISRVRVLDRTTSAIRDLTPADCGFGYRASRFKHNDRYVVLEVTLRLRRSPVSSPLRYPELAKMLGVAPGRGASLADVREAVLSLRRGKGMVIDETDADTRSVGSFFTNPVLDSAAFAVLRERALAAVGTEPSAWPERDGGAKISAAWLIEKAGFGKGYRGNHQGVAISGKHTLALTNRSGGTTAALLALAREIRDGVVSAFGVSLRPEPVLINCSL